MHCALSSGSLWVWNRPFYLIAKRGKVAIIKVATGYYWDDEAQEYVAVETDPIQSSSGAGAIITNVIDYSKWVKC